LAVFFAYGDESQSKAIAALHVPNDCVSSDAAFLNKEIEFGGHGFFHTQVRGLDEEAVDADIQDAGNVVSSVAPPADPDVF
jgi:hypothetical protein